jgi:hypothetical protein
LLLEVLQHITLNLRNPNGANVCSKSPPMPRAPCHDILTVTDEPGPAAAMVQLVTIVELAVRSLRLRPQLAYICVCCRG